MSIAGYNYFDRKALMLEARHPDIWKRRRQIPLLSKKVFEDYDADFDGKRIIPFSEVQTINIPREPQKTVPFNGLLCATSGVGKTSIAKNMVKGFHKAGYKVLYIDAKSDEMRSAKFKGSKTGYKGGKKRMHPRDKNERLPLAYYVPNYVRYTLEQNKSRVISQAKFYSPNIKLLYYPEIWMSLGVTGKATDLIVGMIKKGRSNLKSLGNAISRNRKLSYMTKNASLAAIQNLQRTGFFDTPKTLNLAEEWDEGNVVVISYHNQTGSMMNTDIGLILNQVRDHSTTEKKTTPKLIVFDDASLYAGFIATGSSFKYGDNLAIKNIMNCQSNCRIWGINTLFITQSPDSAFIYPALIDGCTVQIIGYTKNPSSFINRIPRPAFTLLLNTITGKGEGLYIDGDSHTYEFILVKGDMKWGTGFPFEATVGHRHS